MKAVVIVMPRADVLDPQGKAIAKALEHLGFSCLREVRAGKVIELELAVSGPDSARMEATAMAEKLLANTLIETYRIEIA